MPKLKQIQCSIELGPRNVKLHEFGARYNDGHVETFIAIPDTDMPFTIHIKTEGYIAPGLAFFAFMDGEYQCNRNRIGFKVPGPGVEPAQYEAEFRLRQKEEKTAYGSFVGREWSFKKLQMADADKAPQVNSRFLNNNGSIEIVALRCTWGDSSKGHTKAILNLDGSVERCEPSTDESPVTSSISSPELQFNAMPRETATFGGNFARPRLISDGVLLENLLDLTPGRFVGQVNIPARLAVSDVLVENASVAVKAGHHFPVPIHIEESEACAPIFNFDGAGDEPERRKDWNMKSRLQRSRIPATPTNKNYVLPTAIAPLTYSPSDAGIRPVGEGVYDGRARYYDFGGYLPDQMQQSAYAQPYPAYMSGYRPQIQPYPVAYAQPEFDVGAGQMRQPSNSWASLPVGLPMRDKDGAVRRKGGPEMNIVPEDPKEFERLLGSRLGKEGENQGSGYNPNYKRGRDLDDKVENSPSTYEHDLGEKRQNMRPGPQKAKPSPKGKDIEADSGRWAQAGKGTPNQNQKGSWKDQGANNWVEDKNGRGQGQKNNWQDQGATGWAEDKNGKGSARGSKKERKTSDKQQTQQNDKKNEKKQAGPAADDNPSAAVDAANGGWDDAPNNGGGGWKTDNDDKKSKKSSGSKKDAIKDSNGTKGGDANAWGGDTWGAQGGDNNANDWGDNNGGGADGNAWEKKSEGDSKGRDVDRGSQLGKTDNNDNQSDAWPAPSGSKASGPKSGSWVVQSGTAASARSYRPADPQVLIKPYWKDWTKPLDRLEEPDSDAPTLRAEPRCVYQYPEEPLPALPSGKVKGASHAVQAGKGTDYAHLCRRPTYLDTMEAPYAVFAFKYRSKDALEKILKRRIDDSVVEKVKKQVEKDQLLEMPKHKLVEQLLAARK